MTCPQCYSTVPDNATHCPYCGATISAAPPQPNNRPSDYVSPVTPITPVTPASLPPEARDTSDIGEKIFAFLFPVVGIWMYIIWTPLMPKKAKGAALAALIGVIVKVVVIPIIIVLCVTVFAGVFNGLIQEIIWEFF